MCVHLCLQVFVCASVCAVALFCVHLQYFARGYLGIGEGLGAVYDSRLSPLRTATIGVLLCSLR